MENGDEDVSEGVVGVEGVEGMFGGSSESSSESSLLRGEEESSRSSTALGSNLSNFLRTYEV